MHAEKRKKRDSLIYAGFVWKLPKIDSVSFLSPFLIQLDLYNIDIEIFLNLVESNQTVTISTILQIM